MALKFPNSVYFATSTTGTGTITIGSAESGYQTPSGAGLSDGDTFYYAIEDGTAWENGLGTLGGTGTTVARTLTDSSTGSLISLSGSAKMYSTMPESATNGQWFKIDSQSVSAASNLEFTGLESGYDYRLRIRNLVPGTDNVDILCQVGTGATPTWATGASDYGWTIHGADNGAGFNNVDIADSAIVFAGGGGLRGMGNGTDEVLQADLTLFNVGAGSIKPFIRNDVDYWDYQGNFVVQRGYGRYLSATAVTAIRVGASSGTITCDAELDARKVQF